jgi:hypothetical protein
VSNPPNDDNEELEQFLIRLQRLAVRLEDIREAASVAELDERLLRARLLTGLSLVALTGLSMRPSIEILPEFVNRYVREGPSDLSLVAEYEDDTSFPPKLKSLASEEDPSILPSHFDVTDEQISQARSVVLNDPKVRRILGERYIEIISGVDVPDKTDHDYEDDVSLISFEFFSYTNRRAVRTAVDEDRVVFINELPFDYQPAEVEEEIEHAVKLIRDDERFAEVVREAEPEGILTLREEMEDFGRDLYVQFVKEDNRIVLAAVVDLLQNSIVTAMINPDDNDQSVDEKETP